MKKPKTALGGTLKQEFKKNLEPFEYFLVLINNSSPIRNVELLWADDLELFDLSEKPRLNTVESLVRIAQLRPGDAPTRTSPSLSTLFCGLAHGFGSHEEQTCARSDKPARERCRATGCSQIYPCHVGLTDIAVPVACEVRYLGTLFSGQVLTRPPTPEGFRLCPCEPPKPAAHRYGAARGSLLSRPGRDHSAVGGTGAHAESLRALPGQLAEVAGRCGFCNPAYFASVFEKYIHCTPRAYASDPHRWAASSDGAAPLLERAG